MTVYVDVGVVRIQSYLGRWPALRGQRGASTVLAGATADEQVARVLPGSCRLHDEAGRADGVVHLVVDHVSDLEPVISAVFGHLRAKAPASELHAAHAEAPTYTDAHPSIRAMFDSGRAARSHPAVAELPLVQRCRLCSIDMAEDMVLVDDQHQPACRDCLARAAAATRGRDRLRDDATAGPRRTPEERLMAAVGAPSRVDTFEALARMGRPVRGLRNHLATVTIDGNAVGELFRALVGAGSAAKTAVSRAMTDATWTALVEASSALHQPGAPLPVIPHVVGGDDLVASVPAGWAWRFTRVFLTTFDREANGAVDAALDPVARGALGDRRLSVSAGIALAHQRYPFASAGELAEAAMARAKARHPGRAAVCWIDRTRDGDDLPGDRSPVALSELDELSKVLDQLAALDPSRGHALEQAATVDSRSCDDSATAQGRLRRELRRLGVPHPAYGRLGDAADVDWAADMLRLARWWP